MLHLFIRLGLNTLNGYLPGTKLASPMARVRVECDNLRIFFLMLFHTPPTPP